MKKIRRTITMRKIEFTGSGNHRSDSHPEVCPFCQSLISPQLPPTDSVVEVTATESKPDLVENNQQEKK